MKKTLFGRFFLSSLLILAVAYAVILFSMSQFFNQYYLSLKERELKRRGEAIASFLSSPPWEIPETVQRLSEGLQVFLFSFEEIFTKNSPLMRGPRMMHLSTLFRREFPLREIRERLQRGETVAFQGILPPLHQEVLVVAMPLGVPPQAVLLLSTPLTDIRITVKTVRYLLLWSSLIALPFALFLAFLSSRALSLPLQRMRTIARAIALGDYAQRMEIPKEEELGQLAQDFNTLSAELAKTVEVLKREKREIENILLALREGVVAVDREGRVLSANSAIQEVLGVDVKEGALVSSFFPENMVRLFEETLQSGASTQRECRLDKKYLVVQVAPLKEKEIIYGAVGVIQDVTDIRKTEELRRQFIADVSHELRTPVTAIRGFLEAALDEVIPWEEFKTKYLPLLYEETMRLSRLIQDLLDLSLMESGKTEWTMEPLDLFSLAEEVVLKLTPFLQEKNITVRKELPALPFVLGNRDRLIQVLTNLLHNAILFSPENSTITVRGEAKGEEVVVSIIDEGPGIPEEDIPFLFERFYRVEKSRSRKGGGVGLGLAIVQEIVARHGGRVGVENMPQKGSRFFFTLKAFTAF